MLRVCGVALLCAFGCFTFCPNAPAQKIDLNSNGVSDVWEQIYNASSLDPTSDADGDGVSNGTESLAGTDPFDASSFPKIAAFGKWPTNFSVTIPAELGKQYQLQSALALGSTNWISGPAVICRSGTNVTLSSGVGAAPQFFRIAISDVDSDGDGLSDWEEYKLGLNPLNQFSNATFDQNGLLLNDYLYAAGKLPAKNSFSISATDATANEPDLGQSALNSGQLTITRDGFPLDSVTINLGVNGVGAGLATEGVDFSPLPRSLNFPAGVSSQNVYVTPLANTTLKAPVIATMSLQSGSGYTIGSPNSASVVLYPSPTPMGAGLTGQYFNNASSTYGSAQNFSGTSVTRVDPTINFNWGSGSPNQTLVNADNFSAIWEGRLVPTSTGNYQFDLQADDGARLYLDGQLVIDAWTAGSSTVTPIQSAPIALSASTNYPIRVEFYEGTNAALVQLRWKTPTASSFANIPTINVLRPTANISNWLATYFNNTTMSGVAVYTNYESQVNYNWGTGTPDPAIGITTYSVRWSGQIQPQYSEQYYFVANTDDGVKLWINDLPVIDAWTNKGASDVTGTINLQGGTRYNIKMEYYQNTGGASAQLSWYSQNQSKQIIPTGRLYPTNTAPAPSAVTSPLSAVAFVGQPFSFNVTGANSPTSLKASGLPPGLGFTNAVISGVPSLAGNFQVTLTASNSVGLGASLVLIQVIDTGSSVVREVWTGVPGTNIADVPINSPATLTNTISTLEGVTDYGDNYGERVRGYLTAPATGNYDFWIAASDSAELWISNDSEPVNKVKRCFVSPTNSTASRQWNVQANQKSGWLSLVAGQKYYIEVLHKAGVGAGDNWAVGWLQDPTGTNTTPSGVVPGYVLSRFYPLPLVITPGTLYEANMLAQGVANSSAVGSATLQVNADSTQAILKFNYSGLSAPETSEHIHGDSYNGSAQGQILFDIDTAGPQPDGSYVWNIIPVGTLSTADIAEMIREGKTYINVHTANYPGGEINGHFSLANGSQTFTPPPAPPLLTDDHSNSNAAARFLIQATFGPTTDEITNVQSLGYEAWIDNQFTLSASHHLPIVLANMKSDPTTPFPGTLTFNAWWQHAVTAPDQLRQRVAFALSEIMVVSENGVLQDNARALSSYYDVLLDNAFGNYRELLEAVTLHPAMGRYLDMLGNDAGSIITGLHANENYAREIQQLFSVGLYRMWPDGSLVLNSKNELVPTYGQDEIMGFASVFTGWNYYQTNLANGRLPTKWTSIPSNYTNLMTLVPTHHEAGTKLLLDRVMLPAAQGAQAFSTNASFDAYGLNELELAHDSIFKNENVGPFICRQLIQRLVTSDPNRDYLYRVVQKFNDNGSGVRGDMKAVIKAILLDYEARSPVAAALPTYGKQREPVCRVTAPARAFASPPPVGGTYDQTGNQTITVTTTNAHRLNNSDTVFLTFTDTSGQTEPPAQSYGVTVTGPSSFTITAPGLAVCTYGQVGNTITITNNGHGLSPGFAIYLSFISGGAINGTNFVVTVPSANYFTVTATDFVSRKGSCVFPRLNANGGFVVALRTNLTVYTAQPHGLNAGDDVYLKFTGTSNPTNGFYQITSVLDPTRLLIVTSVNNNQTDNGLTVYPLVPPALTRSGNVVVNWSTWKMDSTDGGSTISLSQTPLSSPTVFNFYFPDYKFPGTLASAGLTTPEFQLTSDTSVALQMNFLASGILTNSSSNANNNNTNGLSSFTTGDGDIVLDIRPWMTPSYTSAAGIPSLVDSLNTLLVAGQLSATARSNIISYVTNTTNFAYGSPPTVTQMRERVHAVVHQIIVSPDFTIQK
jgi:uncharacterized protein (DUF1800 family)